MHLITFSKVSKFQAIFFGKQNVGRLECHMFYYACAYCSKSLNDCWTYTLHMFTKHSQLFSLSTSASEKNVNKKEYYF